MDCPGEALLVDLAEGVLAPDERQALDLHLDACPTCRTVVGELARGEEAPAVLARGSTVDRYLLLDPLGTGGMGVVYAAYDGQLDRKVALKLVRPDVQARLGQEACAQLLGEAQALARLSHPNVVTVYEAKPWGEQLFVAMEFVGGTTLKSWLSSPRSRRAVLNVFLAAGAGLAAAHRAGLVHGDFKPGNVLIGDSGRVAVTDFGLARANAGGPKFLGTPAYMSPEQWAQGSVDCQSDQFSFCVALHEALYGVRPFAGATAQALSGAVRAGELRTPASGPHLPVWLRGAVLRGLRPNPGERWPSMDALLHALEGRPRRSWALPLAAASATLLLCLGGLLGVRATRPEAVCSGGGRKLGAVWGAARREQVRSALSSAGTPYAQDASWGAVRALDAYAQAWLAQYTEACEATRVRGEQSEPLLDLRVGCLDQRLSDLGALVALFERSPRQVSERAVQSAYALPPLHACADGRALSNRTSAPTDPAVRSEIQAVDARLSEVRAFISSGHYGVARTAAEAVTQQARKTGHAPAFAEASYQLGLLLAKAQEARSAESALSEAAWSAEVSHDDRLVAEARIALLPVLGLQELRDGHTDRPVREAEAAVARIGRDPGLETSLESGIGSLMVAQDHCESALSHLRRAELLSEAAFDERDPARIEVLDHLGSAFRCVGNFAAARAHHQAALALRERTYGPEHPEVANSLNELANVFHAEGDFVRALPLHERALGIRERTLGERALPTAQSRYNVGIDLTQTGRWSEGRARILQSLAVQESILGTASPRLALGLSALGDVDVKLGTPALAVQELERAIQLLGTRSDDLMAVTRFNLAQALQATRRGPRRAKSLALEAKAYFERRQDAARAQLRTIDTWLELNDRG